MLEDYITSFIDGRLRFRHTALCDTAKAEQVRTLLAAIAGVRAVTVNSRSGSLLLEYNPAQCDKESLLCIMRPWEGVLGLSTPLPVQQRDRPYRIDRIRLQKCVNRGMLATLTASLAFLASGNARGHAVAGGLFVALSACHFYAYRKTL